MGSNEVFIVASEWAQGVSRDFPGEASHVSVKCTCAITFVQDQMAIMGMEVFVEKSFIKRLKMSLVYQVLKDQKVSPAHED